MLHGSIEGFVYLDLDVDGVRDPGEVGVPGVSLRLTGTAGTANVDRSTLTDNTGAYSFGELEAGTYQVAQRQPAAMLDGAETSATSAATIANDAIANLVITDHEALAANNFAERGPHASLVNVTWFMTSTPARDVLLREAVARAEELAGNASLAAAIRAAAPADTSDGHDDDEPTDPDDTPTNPLFGAVTTGAFTDSDLLGIRTDLVSGAPAITATHVTGAVDYTGYSNPPTYGPHHGAVNDGQGNSITPRPTGVYTTEQPDEDLVHNLEHGHVWISYNPSLISATDLTALQQLVTAGGTNTGVILTPRAANTSAIALASWARLLTLDSFDATQVRNFIETNRGHAPEGYIPSGQKSATGGEDLDDGLTHG